MVYRDSNKATRDGLTNGSVPRNTHDAMLAEVAAELNAEDCRSPSRFVGLISGVSVRALNERRTGIGQRYVGDSIRRRDVSGWAVVYHT
jgi:hypothetical protein